MYDERLRNGSDDYDMRDESFRSNEAPESKSSYLQESEDVNEIVLRFNTELMSADLGDPKVFSRWRKDAEYVRSENPDEGKKLLGMLNDRLIELNLEDYVDNMVEEYEKNSEIDPLTNEKIDRAQSKAGERTEAGL